MATAPDSEKRFISPNRFKHAPTTRTTALRNHGLDEWFRSLLGLLADNIESFPQDLYRQVGCVARCRR
jgi:hypothetical protein